MKKNTWRGIVIILVLFGIMMTKTNADPVGADLTRGASSRGVNPDALTADAQAGNITQMNIDQTRITDIWQGFYGNVSGQIVLENAAGNNFYDWTYASLTGEVYASRSTVSDWSTINCTNSTQWQGEETSLGIISTSIDGINETYYTTGHPAFQVGTRTLSGCRSTRPYNSTSTASQFWNVLLNSDAVNVIYTAILADNKNAFDNSTADFEILVPVNRTVGTSTYFFYAELS
jgi:hypothetical protein